jgi:hypothetical protein
MIQVFFIQRVPESIMESLVIQEIIISVQHKKDNK